VRVLISSITDVEYLEILRMSGIVATPGPGTSAAVGSTRSSARKLRLFLR